MIKVTQVYEYEDILAWSKYLVHRIKWHALATSALDT